MLNVALLVPFLKLGRPHFLIGGILLFALGAALSVISGANIDWKVYALGQLSITATQWMTHYANDYFDLDADRANTTPTRWSGGSRVLVAGAVSPRVALGASLVLGSISVFSACLLAFYTSAPTFSLPLCLAITLLSWSYSGPPLRLLSSGLGETTTTLVVTLLTPLLGFYLQRGGLGALLFYACFPLCCLQFAMLLIIELPDAKGDADQGKRTLVVRLGAPWAARTAILLISTAFAALPALFWLDLPLKIVVLAATPLPIAVWQVFSLVQGHYRHTARWEGLAFRGVLLLFLTMVTELLGAIAMLRAKG